MKQIECLIWALNLKFDKLLSVIRCQKRVNASQQCFLRHFQKKFRYWRRIFLYQIMYFFLLDALVQHLKTLFKKLLGGRA
ncbi:hypothetical protein WUBG_18939 [Wuchereria bancrofti]|uniref:Uncharacterized protein n=1 Tax=Wuchereria bancrofti TaxID=6293 RepID=J9E459_WUCBA|nr:hypothetical protein WUBG_18939 [Wuchereria bancrofti]